MLSKRHTKLVIDYVDGSLNPRQRQTVLKLLHKSPKAQRLLEKLKANVELLRRLPKHKLEPQFATKLVGEIKARGLERVSGPMPVVSPAALPMPARRGFPTWAGIAIAAAVLAMVSFGSYLFFANLGERDDDNTPFVQTPPPKPQEKIPEKIVEKTPEKIVPPEPTKPDPLVNTLIAGASQGYHRPIGLVIAGQDLDKQKTKNLLDKQLFTRTSFHVDIASSEQGRTLKDVIAALETKKTRVFVDERAKPEAVRNNPGVEYLVYAENLSAGEVNDILRQLGGKMKADHVQSVQLSALTDGHRSTLSRILGVDEKKLAAPAGKPIEFHNPIEVPKRPPEKKNSDGSKISDPPPSAEPMALVMVLDPGASRSAQIQQFLASRKTMRPGSMQIVMVVHS